MNGNISVSLAPATSINVSDVDDIFGDLITYSLNVDGLAKRDNATHEFLHFSAIDL